MSINCVIINSSPLIVLFKSQQAELLPQLFAEILVPLRLCTPVASTLGTKARRWLDFARDKKVYVPENSRKSVYSRIEACTRKRFMVI